MRKSVLHFGKLSDIVFLEQRLLLRGRQNR